MSHGDEFFTQVRPPQWFDDEPDHETVTERAERRADDLLSDYGSAALNYRLPGWRLTFDEEGDW